MAYNAVPARAFGVNDHRNFLQYDIPLPSCETLHVISDPDGILGRNIGSGLWTAATELVEFLTAKPKHILQGQTVLELGAGLGVVGQVLLPALPISFRQTQPSLHMSISKLLCVNRHWL